LKNKKHGQGTFIYPDGSKYEGTSIASNWILILVTEFGSDQYSSHDLDVGP